MNDKKTIAELKKRINQNFKELSNIQQKILLPRKMLSASLIERYLGTKKHKRTSPAFYLSFRQKGKTKLKYVSKNMLKTVKAQAVGWKQYQQDLKKWRQLSRNIWQDFKQLGNSQDQLKRK